LHHEHGALDVLRHLDGALEEAAGDVVGDVPGDEVLARAPGEGGDPVEGGGVVLEQDQASFGDLGGEGRAEQGEQVAVALDGDDAGGAGQQMGGEGALAGAYLEDGPAGGCGGQLGDVGGDASVSEEVLSEAFFWAGLRVTHEVLRRGQRGGPGRGGAVAARCGRRGDGGR